MDQSVKSERKTRSMRLKENCEEISNSLIKKGYYVRNPELETNNDKDEDVPKSTRKLRRHTLKEQNKLNSEDIPVKKHKQSSKIKKNRPETPDNLVVGVNEEELIVIPEVKQKVKKSKKKKQEVTVEDVENVEEVNDVPKTKKKSKRRKTSKQSSEPIPMKIEENSEIVVKENMLNNSNVSNESYHSATGSVKSEKIINGIDTVIELETAVLNTSSKKSVVNNEKNIDLLKKDLSICESNASKTSEILNESMENKNENSMSKLKHNESHEKTNINEKNTSKVKLDDTFQKSNNNESNTSKLRLNDSHEKINLNVEDTSKINFEDTPEKPRCNVSVTIQNDNSKSRDSHKQRSSSILELDASNSITDFNTTFDKSDKQNKTKSLDATFEKEKLNGTYDLDEKNSLKPDSINKTIDITNNSHISINSEDSKTENLINVTAELVESSNDEISFKNSPSKTETLNIQLPLTPFKREGTYTKESPPYPKEPDTVSIDSVNTGNDACRTPDRRKTLQSPGHTPFMMSSKEKQTVLNVTHSIEKSLRRSMSMSMEPVPRATKVMFCSPTNQATVTSQIKRKVIKSNMKGSNKSFIFDSSVSELSRSGRKRSYTQNDADEVRSKKSKLEDEKKSVERLSRPRTLSATVKATEASTPSKKPVVSKRKLDSKVTRTKLPNFTALHQKQFDKMESLDQCQERKAKRARQLLTPTGSVNLLERISPNEKDFDSTSKVSKEKPKPSTPCTRQPKTMSLAALNPAYTRFGFRLNTVVNPFIVPNKEEGKANESKQLPSRTGATSSRREAAKQTVMREKSFTERNNAKRTESRTIIKGVRTNRRFQLQMQMRNINMN